MYYIVLAALISVFSANFFPHTAGAVVFLLFMTFGLATMSFCFMVSTLFSHARTASIVGMVLYFLMHVHFLIPVSLTAARAKIPDDL